MTTKKQNGTKITGSAFLDCAEAYANALRPIPVPELKTTVYARLLTRADMVQLRIKYEDDREGLIGGMVIKGICDEDGEPLFSVGDRERILKLPHHLLDRLTSAVVGQVEVEEQAKN